MIIMHAIAAHLDISPQEALLTEVRRSAGAVSWLDTKISTANDDLDLVEGGPLYPFVMMWQKERTHLAAVSRAAVSAGLAELIAQKAHVDASALASVLNAVIDSADLSDEQQIAMRAAFRAELLALAGAGAVIEGEAEESAVRLSAPELPGSSSD